MKMSPIMFVSAVVLLLCVGHLRAQGADADEGENCQVIGKGKLTQFVMPKALNVKMPCKYQFSWVQCGKDIVRIYPGQDFDLRNRYYTNTILVTVERDGKRWQGRTETKRVLMWLAGEKVTTAYNVKEDTNAFTMKETANAEDQSVTLKSTTASWTITFTVNYDQKSKESLAKSGITFSCPNSEFVEESMYPHSICGNNTDEKAVRKRRKEIGAHNLNNQVIYDILVNDDVHQTNPHCAMTVSELGKCSDQDARVNAVNKCAAIVRKGSVMKCLGKFNYNPMEVFSKCIKYQCHNDKEACKDMQVWLYGCPKVPGNPSSC